MSKKYLDETGLAYFWQKIKTDITLFFKSIKSSYTTTAENESVIPITFNDTTYRSETDTLSVYVNGFKMIEDIDYSISDNNIVLVNPLEKIGTIVEYTLLRSVATNNADYDLLKGENGITPNIQVGTTTTLEAGSEATVTQRGTTENPIFDFGIPKGSTAKNERVESEVDTYSCDYLNNKNQKHIMTLASTRHSQTFTSWVVSKITNMSVNCFVGDKLSLSDNGIKIGKGVSKVSVSGITTANISSGDRQLTIMRNNVQVASTYSGSLSQLWLTETICPTIISVEEGDIINLGFICGLGGSVEFLDLTRLTVEVIE